MTNDVLGVIDSNYSQKTFLMHTLPILLIKKEVIENCVFICGGYVNSALCVQGARVISVLKRILPVLFFEAVTVKLSFLINSIGH